MADPSEMVVSTKGKVGQYVIPRAEIVNSIGKCGVKSGDKPRAWAITWPDEDAGRPHRTLGFGPSHDYLAHRQFFRASSDHRNWSTQGSRMASLKRHNTDRLTQSCGVRELL
jgi:hypothetical protein